ncbi:hypothetical protein PPERSA_11925 [Pseudocohnilembus persalinus]|uniref:Uncharacterized protein n=1 Tax=Pseudocohnilembus persalinus TaxID=266149 RepID=A0A0V0QJY1_PSEPJ|nr:hypothetical protein PPERSA_11925 [Pseudocohnilembus persalinus]|eukprot:KRX02585.1 hypothetical protein PPERSA_11925 [Pseudocohnilembus persalinus]
MVSFLFIPKIDEIQTQGKINSYYNNYLNGNKEQEMTQFKEIYNQRLIEGNDIPEDQQVECNKVLNHRYQYISWKRFKQFLYNSEHKLKQSYYILLGSIQGFIFSHFYGYINDDDLQDGEYQQGNNESMLQQ